VFRPVGGQHHLRSVHGLAIESHFPETLHHTIGIADLDANAGAIRARQDG
jgi:hypothetical protein